MTVLELHNLCNSLINQGLGNVEVVVPRWSQESEGYGSITGVIDDDECVKLDGEH